MGGGPTIQAPEQVDAGQSMLEYIRGISDPQLQEKIYQAESQFRPRFTELSLRDMEHVAFGTENQAGALDMLLRSMPAMNKMQSDALTSQRTSDIRDIENLGGRATAALRASDPEMQRLLGQQGSVVDQLFGRAQGVTPQQQRMAQQQSREAGMARGRGFDQGTIAGEILGREEFQQQNRQEYLGAAGQRFGMLQATTADPFQAILGRPGMAANMAQQQQGFNQYQSQAGMGPQLFDPNMGVNLAMQQQSNMGNFNSAMAGASATRSAGMMGMAGSIGGAAIGAMAI